ncbi:MAG: LacI family DNA-binding transcriptional regulator [Saccharospirillum sp.]
MSKNDNKTATKRMTLKTVAEALNVSTATISNAFNRPDQLSAALREHILMECKRLGYNGPNPAARSLRTGATGIVGVMLAERLAYNFRDGCATEFLQGVSEVLDDARINMLLMPGRDDFYQLQSLESIPDRYIVYGPPRDLGVIKRIESQRKPVVTVDFSLPNHLSLNVDNYGGAKQAARHVFMNMGPGPVAVIGLRLIPSDDVGRIKDRPLLDPVMSISRQRLEAYRDAAAEVGIEISGHQVWNTHESNWADGVKAAREALSATPRPQALFCMSDQLALAALSVARDLNIQVPEQLRIIGFDDTPEARRSHPAVTTVYQPSIEKGRLAAMMVLHPERYESRVLPTQLHIRETG